MKQFLLSLTLLMIAVVLGISMSGCASLGTGQVAPHDKEWSCPCPGWKQPAPAPKPTPKPEPGVSKANITVDIEGPTRAQVGEDITYRIIVRNTGNLGAKDVVVSVNVPQGLAHATGQQTIKYELGDMPAGASKEMTIVLRSLQPGKFTTVAKANASNAPEGSDNVTTTVEQGVPQPTGPCDICGWVIIRHKPVQATVGQEYTADIDVIALANVSDVNVSTTVPDGLTYIKSEPPASVNGRELSWNMGPMQKGQTKTIRIWYRADREGTIPFCFYVKANPYHCVVTNVTKPAIAIEKSGPETAQVGEDINYTVTVRSTGTAVAKDVVIYDQVPDGLVHASGQRELKFPIGDLAPGASKTMTVVLKATRPGRFVNVARAVSSNAGQVQDDAPTTVILRQLELTMDCVQEQSVGTRSTNTITVSNPGDVRLTNVTLRGDCSGVQIVSAEGAQVSGSSYTWNIGTLNPKESKQLRVVCLATVETRSTCQVTVNCAENLSKNQTCSTFWKGMPKLEIVKTGPATAFMGQDIAYEVEVKNTGTALAKDVNLQDRIPQGLVHSSGRQEVAFQLGDLPPGASKKVSIPVKVNGNGQMCNVAVAKGVNTEAVQAQACTRVQTQSMDMKVDCPESNFVGKQTASRIVLSNTGDVPLTNITVTSSCASAVKILSATGNPTRSGNQTVWQIGNLQPGENKTFELMLISKEPGKHCCQITANCAQGITKSANCCTFWKGFAAILLELIDTEDPLLVGEETTYVIEVTNQGTADDKQVRIVADFPAETTPLSASGATTGSIDGKTVTFAPYPVIKPKEKIKYEIRAKGVQSGDARLKIKLYSELLETPVPEEESTHVY